MNKIAIVLAVAALAGCASHHHHHTERADEYIIVHDDHGWDHHGWYDRHGDWHGYYFDERHVRHEDEHDWGRMHDREWEHRERHDWNEHH